MIRSDRMRGSLLRCLQITGLPRAEVAAKLTELARPSGAIVSPATDIWMPRGSTHPFEARIERDKRFLDADKSEEVKTWWLVYRRGANTPNWDIASTSTIAGVKGLILVEAKAHDKELFIDGKSKPTTANSKKNHEQIGIAIHQANDGLNKVLPGWSLTHDSHYQGDGLASV